MFYLNFFNNLHTSFLIFLKIYSLSLSNFLHLLQNHLPALVKRPHRFLLDFYLVAWKLLFDHLSFRDN